MRTEALIFDIRRYAIHDGPGIRTTIFFKGCLLNCYWCQNPESIEKLPEIFYFQQRCISCGKCINVCPINGQKGEIDKDSCLRCGKCAEVCYSEARKMIGTNYSPEELFNEVKKDKIFFENSDGGITLSGGEPLLQVKFLENFLNLCKNDNLHIAVDTCGCVHWDSFVRVLPYADLFLYDLKVMDPINHRQYTGVDNALILENIKRLTRTGKDIHIRIPLIPGYTDTMDNIDNTADFIINELNRSIKRVDLLPYNKMAESKYCQSSIYKGGNFGEYKLKSLDCRDEEYLNKVRQVFEQYEIPVYLEII